MAANGCPNCKRAFDIVNLGTVEIPWSSSELKYKGKSSNKVLHVGFGCRACGSHWLRPKTELKDEMFEGEARIDGRP